MAASPENRFDLVVIGAGPGGYTAALAAGRRGARVAVVEKEALGGVCTNRGCISTKSLIASMEAYRTALKGNEFGFAFEGAVTPNLERMVQRKDQVVARLVKGIESLLKAGGVALMKGEGRLLSAEKVAVQTSEGERILTARAVILAPGSRPRNLPAFPFDGEAVLSSDQILDLTAIPQRLVIAGGGVIGCEFASLFAGLGTEVAIVEAQDRILSLLDGDLREILLREFKKQKIKVLTGATIASVQKTDEGVACLLSTGETLTADHLLSAAGRSLNTENLGLETVGVELGGRGEIVVDEFLRTSCPSVFAVGDASGVTPLAHAASAQARIAVQNALGAEPLLAFDPSVMPWGIFTHPEIGAVGATEEELKETGAPYRAGLFPLRALGRAQTTGELAGVVKILADSATDRVLGLHILGAHAAELIHEGALAIAHGLTTAELGAVIHAHPTFAEGILEAAHALHHESLHLPPR